MIPRNRLLEKETAELLKHRQNGHSTYHPSCEACRVSKSVYHHRRKTQGKEGVELAADFGVINNIKILCLTEASSGSVGYVAVGSSREIVVNEILRWVQSVGVTGPSTSVVLCKSDLEPALLSLLKQAIPGRVESVPPQAHEQVGSAERTVRRFKEQWSCLQYDARMLGYGYHFNEETANIICRYIAGSHNNFHHVHGGSATPTEIVTGRKAAVLVNSALGSTVFAEVPNSVETPEGTRWIPAAFLGYQYGSRACLVSGIVGTVENLHVKVFQAKSIRSLNKIVFETSYAPSLLFRLPEKAAPAEPMSQAPQDLRIEPATMPKAGPPINWIRTHGRTKDCYACSNSKGVHSKTCKERYLKWSKEQTSVSQPVFRNPQPAFDIPELDADMSQDDLGNSEPFPIPEVPNSLPAPFSTAEDMEIDAPSDYCPSVPMTPRSEPDNQPMELDQLFSEDDPIVSELLQKMLHFSDNVGFHGELDTMFLPKIGLPTKFEALKFAGTTVYLAEPVKVLSEDTLEQLDLEQTCKGRKVELNAMDDLHFGRIVSRKEAFDYCKKHSISPISTRWVITKKQIDGELGVRCRLVVQQVASGTSAANLGYSSATPSGEAVRALLAKVARSRWHLFSLDVSTAFMNASLPPGTYAVIRLPGDISSSKHTHEATYAILNRALNGLRCASKAWLNLAKEICLNHGLDSNPSDPCIFRGEFKKDKFRAQMILVIYVDDLLLGSDHPDAAVYVKAAFLERVAKIKIQGEVLFGKTGSLTSLGREVKRQSDSESVYVRVPPTYLQDILRELKATPVPPGSIEGKIEGDDLIELDTEAASTFRTKLGKLAWYTQTRLDLLRFTSVLATGQSKPLRFHAKALIKTLKFVKASLHFWHEFKSQPSKEEEGIVLWVDAAWGAKSVSGYLITWNGCVLKAVSKQQTTIALSSCEAELVSLAQGSQETIGIMGLIGFIEGIFHATINTFDDFLKSNPDEVAVQDSRLRFKIRTDSLSGTQVMQADGFNRRTRHLNISILFIQKLVRSLMTILEWTPGIEQIADCLTKILDKTKVEFFRAKMGYVEIEPPEPWQDQADQKPKAHEKSAKQFFAIQIQDSPVIRQLQLFYELTHEERSHSLKWILLLELCTSKSSGFSPVHMKQKHGHKIFVLQVTKEDDFFVCGKLLFKRLLGMKWNCEFRLVTYFSPPCTGGSPVQHLQSNGKEERLEKYRIEFEGLCKMAQPFFNISSICLVELSRQCSYWRYSKVLQACLDKSNMVSCAYFSRCAYDPSEKIRAKHVYRIQSNFSLSSPLECSCDRHLPLEQQNLSALGSYPVKMAEVIVDQICNALQPEVWSKSLTSTFSSRSRRVSFA